MTLLQGPLLADQTDPKPGLPRVSLSPAAWMLAARLARREIWRRPGRTALVALLVAVPILAMTIGSIVVRSNTDAARFSRSYGNADIALIQTFGYDRDIEVMDTIDIRERIGDLGLEGTQSTQYVTTFSSVRSASGVLGTAKVTGLEPGSPITADTIDIDTGRLPQGPDEVLLHPTLLATFGISVGDTLMLDRPDRSLVVVGVGREVAYHSTPLMVLGDLDVNEVRQGSLTTLYDFPGDNTAEDVSALGAISELFDSVESRPLRVDIPSSGSNDTLQEPSKDLAWGWVIGVLSLAAAGVIIAAAFATSARRQLATVGQLAANGASPKLIRRTLALQGTWSGMVGSAFGIGLAIAAFQLGIPLIEWIAGRGWNQTKIVATDLALIFVTGVVAATLAALLPARSLAKTSVLSALAGRRPIRPVQARTVGIGLACFAGGLLTLMVAATGAKNDPNPDADLFAAVALVGSLGVLAGMCLASPVAISAASSAVGRLGPNWRLSGRSLYRTRWRSAAVVTAIGVAGALAIAAATTLSVVENSANTIENMARNVTTLRANGGQDLSSIETSTIAEVRELVGPSAESIILGVDLPAPTEAQLDAYYGGPEEYGLVFTASTITVADNQFIAEMGLSDDDRARFDETGIATTSGRGGIASLLGNDELIAVNVAPLLNYTSRNGSIEIVMKESLADELGIEVIPVGIRFESKSDLTAGQRRGLDDIRLDPQYGDSWIEGDTPADPAAFERSFWIDYQHVYFTLSTSLFGTAIAAAALLLVLVVVGIGLSLAAADSREEHAILIAVGASPSTMRLRSAIIAVILSVTGGLIAVPTGLLPVWVVYRTVGTDVEVPGRIILTIVAVIPLVVGAIAWAGSSITHRLRPLHVSTRFAD